MVSEDLMLESFDSYYQYSHVVPFEVTNYIDGMFHVSMIRKAAATAGHDRLVSACDGWLDTLLLCPDARNWSRLARDGWLLHDGVYYKIKPQSFAGPCAYGYAMGGGPRTQAWLLYAIAPIYLRLAPYSKILDQHTNSIVLSHLLLGKKLPNCSRIRESAFYSYFAGRPPASLVGYPTTPWCWKQVPCLQDTPTQYNLMSLYVYEQLCK